MSEVSDKDVFDKDTAFWFPVNDPKDESVTNYRLTFKKGTTLETAREVTNEFLVYLGYDPEVILEAMEFNELLNRSTDDTAKESSGGGSSTD